MPDRLFTVETDSPFNLKPATVPVVLPGASIDPIFVITGARPFAAPLELCSGMPVNHILVVPDTISEIFLIDGVDVLQLTNFGREDTGFAGVSRVDVDGERVYFGASANPPELGDNNPSENCQIFSVDRNGSDLRQLTNFSDAPHSKVGCTYNSRGLGCASEVIVQDARTRQLIMYSSCNPPEGTNPDGDQVFAMNPDGSGLQQLTDARGLFKQPDGTVVGELPGLVAYGPYLP